MKLFTWILFLGAGLRATGCNNLTDWTGKEERTRKSIERVLPADRTTNAGTTSVL
jgi:hypothetical protein